MERFCSLKAENTNFVKDWETGVAVAAIDIGVEGVARSMRSGVNNYLLRKSDGAFYVPPKCPQHA
jgi:hypothetical protein